MLSKSIVETYLGEFVNRFHGCFNDGIRFNARGIIYDGGGIVCIDVLVGGRDSQSVDTDNVTFRDAINKIEILEGASFAVMADKRAVFVIKNKVILCKKEDGTEWSLEAANSDVRKVINVIKRK